MAALGATGSKVRGSSTKDYYYYEFFCWIIHWAWLFNTFKNKKLQQWNIHSKILPANLQPKRKKHSKSDKGLSKVIPLIIILILTVCTHNVPVQYTITIFLGDNSQINSLCISAGNQGNLYNVKKEYNKHRYQTHRKMWAHNLHHWNNFFLIRSNIQCTIIYCRR